MTAETSTNALPQEMIEEFLNFLESDLDVRSCSVVCQNWRAASLSRLFSSIFIPLNTDSLEQTKFNEVLHTVQSIFSIFHNVTHMTLNWAYSNSSFECSLSHLQHLVFPRLSKLTIARFHFDETTDSYVTPMAELIKQNATIDTLTFRRCRFRSTFGSQHRLVEILAQCQGPSSPRLTQFSLENWSLVDGQESATFNLISLQRPSEIAIEIMSSDVRMQADHIMGRVGLTDAVLNLMNVGPIYSLSVQGVRLNGVQSFGGADTLQRLSIDCFSLDQHRLLSYIANNCTRLQSLTLRFNSLGCALNIYISHGAFLDLRTLNFLQELNVDLDIRCEESSSVSMSIADLDRALTSVVQTMPSLLSVLVSVKGGELNPETCFTLIRDIRPGILRMTSY